MNAPSRPRPTWSVALWWEWYIIEPGRLAVNSYVYDSPGANGFWVTNGTPSWKKSSNSTPWKWTPVVSCRLLVKIDADLRALGDPDRGPRGLPVVAEGGHRRLELVDRLLDLVDGDPEHGPLAVGRRGERIEHVVEDQLRHLHERRA